MKYAQILVLYSDEIKIQVDRRAFACVRTIKLNSERLLVSTLLAIDRNVDAARVYGSLRSEPNGCQRRRRAHFRQAQLGKRQQRRQPARSHVSTSGAVCVFLIS